MTHLKAKQILTILINFFLFFGFPSISNGQPLQKMQPIIISGTVSDSFLREFLIEEPYISFYDHYNQNLPEAKQIVPIHIVGNKFSAMFLPKKHVVYFSIGSGTIQALGTGNVFLITEGDNLNIKITDTYHVHFDGQGADKLNYQHWAGNFIRQQNQKSFTATTEIDTLNYYKQLASTEFYVLTDSLYRLSGKEDPKLFDLLRFNTAYSIKWSQMENVVSKRWGCDSLCFKVIKREIDCSYAEESALVNNDIYIIENAFMYQKYLVDLCSIKNQLNTHLKTPPFKDQFYQIKGSYTGALRDIMLSNFFLTAFRYSPDAVDYLEDAKKTITDSLALFYLNKIAGADMPGTKAFDFFVVGVKGEPIKLNDFKGKILIIDTWYKGCTFCVLLAKGMEPVQKYFKQRNDVVFLSLDAVDKDRNKFLTGVKSGEYGSSQSIYAWTNGLGVFHPMILHYQYTAYPNLLIIGKDGKIISANPEKPLDDITQAKMIRLIEKNL